MPYEVIKRIPNQEVKGVTLGEKYNHKFREGVSFRLPDSERGQAMDLAQSIGQDRTDGRDASVLVQRIPDRSTSKIRSTGFGPGKWDEIRKEKERERNEKRR